jgi:hypothetical protein
MVYRGLLSQVLKNNMKGHGFDPPCREFDELLLAAGTLLGEEIPLDCCVGALVGGK